MNNSHQEVYTDISIMDLHNNVNNTLQSIKLSDKSIGDNDNNELVDYSSHSHKWLSTTKWFKSLNAIKHNKINEIEIVLLLRNLEKYAKLLSGKNVKVLLTDDVTGSTNGEVIFIPSYYTLEETDVAIGMTLHEASHVKYTDFFITNKITQSFVCDEMKDLTFTNWVQKVAMSLKGLLKQTGKYTDLFSYFNSNPFVNCDKLLTNPTKLNTNFVYGLTTKGIELIDIHQLFNHAIFPIINIIEDFFIDDNTYSKIPTYREYYEKLYINCNDKNQDNIDSLINMDSNILDNTNNTLKQSIHNINSSFTLLDLYLIKICMLGYNNNDLSTLPPLKEISDLIDLPNIRRLTSTEDRIILAFKVFDIMMKDERLLVEIDKSKINQTSNNFQIKNNIKSIDTLSKILNEIDSSSFDENFDKLKEIIDNNTSTLNDFVVSKDNCHLGFQQYPQDKVFNVNSINDIKNHSEISSQLKDDNKKSNNNYDSKFTPHSSPDVKLINTIKLNNNFEIVKNKYIHNDEKIEYLTYILHNLKSFKDIIQTVDVYQKSSEIRKTGLMNGLMKGKQMSKKLQFRNQEYVLKHNRIRTGKIDKNLLHQLGMSNESNYNSFNNLENIFYNITTDYFNDYVFYIDLDLSGSIDKMIPSIDMFTSILVGSIKELSGVEIVVTGRITKLYFKECSSYDSNTSNPDFENPITIVLYDSRKDTVQDFVKNMLDFAHPLSLTPEMLLYENIRVMSNREDKKTKKVFISLTDGDPSYDLIIGKNCYGSRSFFKNINTQVLKRLKEDDIEFMCFFLNDGTNDSRSLKSFDELYGKTGHIINIENINEISKIINNQITKMDTK